MYLVFDIGATKTRLAVSADGITLSEPKIYITPQKFHEGIGALLESSRELAGEKGVEVVVGGVAALLDHEKTTLLKTRSLTDWVGKPFRKELEQAFGAPVFLENDSALVGLGEATVGAGRGYPIVAYITVSTGVGGARIVKGEIDQSAFGFEPGHQIIDAGGKLCPECHPTGELEAYISGSAVEKRFRKKPYDIHDPDVWDELAKFLAIGLGNTILHWSPDVVVVGGSMMKKVGIPVERVRAHLADIGYLPTLPPVNKAILGDLGGLYGALTFLRQRFISTRKNY